MAKTERRKSERKPLLVTTIVRKSQGAGEYEIMEFRTRDMSSGGIFISTEDLSIFELGDEVEILVDDSGERYFEGKARVVRSARVFTDEGNPVESGFGIMFLTPETDSDALSPTKE
jgi:hypothetical protein